MTESTRPAGPSGEEPSISYEAAREELMTVVQRLESGGTPLEESLALWERGEQLAAICQRWLDGARAKVEQARANSTPAGVEDAGSPSGNGPTP